MRMSFKTVCIIGTFALLIAHSLVGCSDDSNISSPATADKAGYEYSSGMSFLIDGVIVEVQVFADTEEEGQSVMQRVNAAISGAYLANKVGPEMEDYETCCKSLPGGQYCARRAGHSGSCMAE